MTLCFSMHSKLRAMGDAQRCICRKTCCSCSTRAKEGRTDNETGHLQLSLPISSRLCHARGQFGANLSSSCEPKVVTVMIRSVLVNSLLTCGLPTFEWYIMVHHVQHRFLESRICCETAQSRNYRTVPLLKPPSMSYPCALNSSSSSCKSPLLRNLQLACSSSQGSERNRYLTFAKSTPVKHQCDGTFRAHEVSRELLVAPQSM